MTAPVWTRHARPSTDRRTMPPERMQPPEMNRIDWPRRAGRSSSKVNLAGGSGYSAVLKALLVYRLKRGGGATVRRSRRGSK